MSDIKVTLPAASEPEQTVTAGTKAWELFTDTPDVIAARINGNLRDLARELENGDVVEPVAIDSPDGHDILRHSTAHVMAQAVQELYPEAKLGIGPPIENGFYYDFDVPEPFKPEDLEEIETRMRKIIKEGQRFSRRAVSDDEARAELETEPYKLELIGLKGGAAEAAEGASAEVGAGELTIYDNLRRDGSLAWKDLCRGPHLPTTKRIPAFKLMRGAAAYWRGSEKNPQLQRIYGTAWESKDALEEHLQWLEEAERRDHRRLGRELDLFSFPDEIGSGLAVFHPKGGVVRKEMEDYSRHSPRGVRLRVRLHPAHHQGPPVRGLRPPGLVCGGYVPADADGQRHRLLPQADELPDAQPGLPVARAVLPGAAVAALRVRDRLPLREVRSGPRHDAGPRVHPGRCAHPTAPGSRCATSSSSLLQFVLDLLRDYGLDDFYLELSTKDPEKFVGDDETWEEATRTLEQVATASGLALVPDPGGAAFYGPKISVQTRDAIGRTWQMSTIQLDFNLPELFGLEYTAPDGSRQRPVMIHRALFGSIERFVAVLTEHYGGAFPPWLAPVQVVAIPIAERHNEYLLDVARRLREHGIRVEVDDSDDRMQKKIRNAQLQKVPFMLLAGDRDVEADAVSFRYRGGEEDNGVPVDEAIERVVEAVSRRIQV